MVGPEQLEVPLPQVPLPIRKDLFAAADEAGPGDVAIGTSIYEYLRRYPDCQYNREYAELLREAYPHYITDLASQAVMLGHKDVSAAYLQRLVNYLKILLLLDPQNPGLLLQIGLNYYRLAMNFEVLADCRSHLLAALQYLSAPAFAAGSDPAATGHLAQIAYLFGDYKEARRHWEQVLANLSESEDADLVHARLDALKRGEVPRRPLLEDLEAIGEAMVLYGAGDQVQAGLILEDIEERGDFCRTFPLAEFHYLLGMCRQRAGEAGAAFESFENALRIDPDYAPAIEAREAFLNQGG